MRKFAISKGYNISQPIKVIKYTTIILEILYSCWFYNNIGPLSCCTI